MGPYSRITEAYKTIMKSCYITVTAFSFMSTYSRIHKGQFLAKGFLLIDDANWP